MYEHYFQLARKPFDLLPNPDFLYPSKSHSRALSYLDYGIRERMGFILLTGEVGSGKTTLIRNLIRKNLGSVVISKVFNTRVDSEQLIAMINDDFGLPVQNRDKITMLRDLNEFLIDQYVRGRQPVLIIDEAQNLAHDQLEEIRMLSNLETDNSKLLQIILVGQPELRQTIASDSMVQLRQRISINCHLTPLSLSETGQYVLHRLDKAGNRSAVIFTSETIQIIFTYSRGIPRLINIICDFILLAAFAEGTTTVDAPLVQDIIGDLDFEHHFWGSESSDGKAYEQPGTRRKLLSTRAEKTISVLIRDIHDRLESLGKETDSISNRLLNEFDSRISGIEQSLKTHQETTGTLIGDLYRTMPQAGGADDAEPSPQHSMVPSGGMFGGMFGRLFGYRA